MFGGKTVLNRNYLLNQPSHGIAALPFLLNYRLSRKMKSSRGQNFPWPSEEAGNEFKTKASLTLPSLICASPMVCPVSDSLFQLLILLLSRLYRKGWVICVWCFLGLSYTWIFNDKTLYVQEDSRRFVSQDTGNLYIAKVEPSDVGNYTCVVTNSKAERSARGPPTPLTLRRDGKFSECAWLQRGSTALTGPAPVTGNRYSLLEGKGSQ